MIQLLYSLSYINIVPIIGNAKNGGDFITILPDDGHLGDTVIPENTDLSSNKIPEIRYLLLSSINIYGAKYRIYSSKT